MAPIKYNIDNWVSQNESFFAPPICNKLMYGDGQIKCFFVGGPNVRKDFHLEEGEEFFYMLKGDMNLIVGEQGKFRDVIIKEGEVFLLSPRIPHSPQRFPKTLGMVIERERSVNEVDGLRYYMENSADILYEKWFHCEKVDSQLPPLIREFFASTQFKTGKPLPGTILEDKPVTQDFNRIVDKPFSLKQFISDNREELNTSGKKKLFEGDYFSRIDILAKGSHEESSDLPETFLMQLEGNATVECENKIYSLNKNHTLLINKNEKWKLKNGVDASTLSVIMNIVR